MSELTHIDAEGEDRMVDVSAKAVTRRLASASPTRAASSRPRAARGRSLSRPEGEPRSALAWRIRIRVRGMGDD